MFSRDSDARFEFYPPRLLEIPLQLDDAAVQGTRRAPARRAVAKPEITDDVVPDSPTTYELMRVVSVDDGWALMVDDVDEPAWVVSTKKKAVKAAKGAAQDLGTELVIHTAAGKVQKRFDYTA